MDEVAKRLAEERRRLEAARALLLEQEAELDDEHPIERSGTSEHLADSASDTLELEVERSVAHAVERELRDIAAAEARIGRGTYGRCETCGGPIGTERLRAIPWATRCLDDQLRAEAVDGSIRVDVLHGPSEIEAVQHTDLIPDGDAADGLDLSAEEQALHIQR